MQKEGYWINENIIYDVTNNIHVRKIKENPSIFKTTENHIKNLENQYNEKIEQEGKAREILIKEASMNGWIRVRHYTKPDYWSIQFDEWEKRKETVKSFVEWAINLEIMTLNDELRLSGYFDGTIIEYLYMTGGVKRFLDDTKEIKNKPMKYVDWN